MKLSLIISALFLSISCGRQTDYVFIPPVTPVQPTDFKLTCDVFDLTKSPSDATVAPSGIPNFKLVKNLGNIEVDRVDNPSNTSADVFNMFADTPLASITENFGLNCKAVLDIKVAGSYQFALNADDGATLTIGSLKVIDNNGDHAMTKKYATVLLMEGHYTLNMTYYNHSGVKGLILSYRRPNASLEEVLEF